MKYSKNIILPSSEADWCFLKNNFFPVFVNLKSKDTIISIPCFLDYEKITISSKDLEYETNTGELIYVLEKYKILHDKINKDLKEKEAKIREKIEKFNKSKDYIIWEANKYKYYIEKNERNIVHLSQKAAYNYQNALKYLVNSLKSKNSFLTSKEVYEKEFYLWPTINERTDDATINDYLEKANAFKTLLEFTSRIYSLIESEKISTIENTENPIELISKICK